MEVIAGRTASLASWLDVQSRRSLASSCFTGQLFPEKRILRSRIIIEISEMGSWCSGLDRCYLQEIVGTTLSILV